MLISYIIPTWPGKELISVLKLVPGKSLGRKNQDLPPEEVNLMLFE